MQDGREPMRRNRKKLQDQVCRRVVGYARVSTIEQATEGVSLDAQRAKIEAYCGLHGLDLAEIFVDEGISAKDIIHRPAASRALELIKRGKVHGLVIFKLDRLARNTKDALEIAELFRRKGAALHSISEKVDTDSAIGGFFFTLMAALAELERKQIGERTAAALAYKRANGEKTGGDVPFGFDAHAGKLLPNELEQQVIDIILGLDNKGYTLRQIAGELDRRGIQTKQGKTWKAIQVSRVLKRAA